MEDKRFNKTYFEVITYLPKRLQCLLRVLPPKIIDNLTEMQIIYKYLDLINLNDKQIEKLNNLRVSTGLSEVQ